MNQPTLQRKRLEAVRGLFGEDNAGIPLLRFHLQSVAAELLRIASIAGPIAEKAAELGHACTYVTTRLNDVLARRGFSEWLPGQFQQPGGDRFGMWGLFADLAVKDFHSDVSSLMDSVAPVVILMDGELKSKHTTALPGFPDIQSSSKRTYRRNMRPDLQGVVDETDSWWPPVKRLRDLLVHRPHQRLIFGGAEDGFLFQVYERDGSPVLTLPEFLAREDSDIADFALYSSWVLVEIIYFFDSLGRLAVDRFNLRRDVLTISGRVGGMRPLIRDLDALLARVP